MAISHNKNVGHSAYKVRRVIDLIRSRPVSDAKIQLDLLGSPVALEILKILFEYHRYILEKIYRGQELEFK